MAEETRMIDVAAWREGRRRALELLRDIENASYNDTGAEPEWREGRPQENVAHGHLFALMTTQNRDVIEAFSAVLTNYLGDVAHSGVPDWDHLEATTLDPILTRMSGLSARVSVKPFGDAIAQLRVSANNA
jgi:hypothetical protein